MEKLKAVKNSTQKKVGDFEATFGEQERVNKNAEWSKKIKISKKRIKTGQHRNKQ